MSVDLGRHVLFIMKGREVERKSLTDVYATCTHSNSDTHKPC